MQSLALVVFSLNPEPQQLRTLASTADDRRRDNGRVECVYT